MHFKNCLAKLDSWSNNQIQWKIVYIKTMIVIKSFDFLKG